jgi:hypothetical protein
MDIITVVIQLATASMASCTAMQPSLRRTFRPALRLYGNTAIWLSVWPYGRNNGQQYGHTAIITASNMVIVTASITVNITASIKSNITASKGPYGN